MTPETLTPQLVQERIERRKHHVFLVVAMASIFAPLVGEVASYLASQTSYTVLPSSLLISLSGAATYLWYRATGKLDTAVTINAVIQILCFSWGAIVAGGTHSEQFFYLSLFPVLNGFFLGRRAALITTVYAILFALVIGGLEYADFITAKQPPVSAVTFQTIACLAIIGWLTMTYERERLLKESELTQLVEAKGVLNRYYDRTLEGAGLGSWDWMLETDVVHFDRRWCEMIGLDYKTVEHTFATWDSRVHPEDKAKCYEDIRAHVEGRTLYYENIHRLRHSDGTWVWIFVRGRISGRDVKGKPTRFTGTHFDITRLKETERLSSELQSVANIGGWELDFKSKLMRWTDQTYQIHALSPHESPTLDYALSFLKDVDRERMLDYLHKALNGSSFRDTFEMIDNKGANKWVNIVGIPILGMDGKVIGLRGTIQDISELTRLRSQLEEAQYVAKMGNWQFSLSTRRIEWSKQMYQLFNVRIQDGPPSMEQHLQNIHPDDRENWQKTVQRTIDEGTPYTIRYRSLFPDKVLWIEAIGRGLYNREGHLVAIAGTCQDITEKVESEKQLEQQRLKIIHAAKLASLGEMSAGVAHEINNPLAVIKGTLNLLPEVRTQDSEFNSKMAMIERAVTRISKIVNGLRRFTRAADGTTMTSTSLSQIIAEANVITDLKAKRFDVTVTSQIEGKAQILCDPIEIEQVVINLINNGIDAAKEAPSRWVKVHVFDSGDQVVLHVMDSGLGVSVETEGKLFQPFFTTKPIGEGTGLGLSICKGILDQHHATIQLNRNYPHTCFEVRFNRHGTDGQVA